MAADSAPAFVSYSRADAEFALKLAEDLKNGGANIWLDQLDIEPGERWARAVQAALAAAPRILVILSPASVNSNNVEDEVAFAVEKRKKIIPIFYQDCEVPFQLLPFQYVDFRTDYARGLGRLLKTLATESRQATVVAASAAAVAPVVIPSAPQLSQEHAEQAAPDTARGGEREQAAAAEQYRKEREERERKEAQKQARQEELERQSLAAAQAQREEDARKAVEEKARLEQEERVRKAAEEKARLEALERQRFVAEQARRDEDARNAAEEKARLEEKDRERKAAEEKARQEELERQRVAAEEARLKEERKQAALRKGQQLEVEATPPIPEPAQRTKFQEEVEKTAATATSVGGHWKPLTGAVLLNLALGSLFIWFIWPGFLFRLAWGSYNSVLFGTLLITLPSAAAWIVAGRLQDRVGPFHIALSGGVLFSVGLFLCALGHSPFYFYLFAVICGIGAGAGMATTVPVVSKCYPNNRGLPIGVAIAASAGALVFSPLAAALVSEIGVLRTLPFAAVICLIMSVTGTFLLRQPIAAYGRSGAAATDDEPVVHTRDVSPGQMLRISTFWWMWVAYLLGFSAWSVSRLPLLDVPRGVIDFTTIGSVAGAIVMGWISDRVGRLKMLRIAIGAALITLIAMLLLWGAAPFAVILVLEFLLNACDGAQSSIYASATADFWGTRNVGVNYGVLRSASAIASISTLILARFLYWGFNSRSMFLGGAILAAAALVCACFAKTSRLLTKAQNV